jgi:hypothetical protein
VPQTALTDAFLYGVGFGMGQFVIVGAPEVGSVATHGNILLRSFDGEHWQNLSSTVPTSWSVFSSTFLQGSFWVSGEAGTILQSDPVIAQTFLVGKFLPGSNDYQLSVWGGEMQDYVIQASSNGLDGPWFDRVHVTDSPPCYNWTISNIVSGSGLFRTRWAP